MQLPPKTPSQSCAAAAGRLHGDLTPLKLLAADATLHPHQVAYLGWAAGLWHAGCGGILGDQMGLGKTLEAISLIAYACGEVGEPGPFLVVCPLRYVDVLVKVQITRYTGMTVVSPQRSTKLGIRVPPIRAEAGVFDLPR